MRARRWLVVAVLVAIAVAPGAASAHSTLVSAEPAPGARLEAPPASVRLVFSAPVEEAFLTVRVRNADWRVVSGPPRRDPRVARAVIVPVDAIGDGEMHVEWRVLSQDGHPSGGVFAFGVGPSPVTPEGIPSSMARSDHGPLGVGARLLALSAPLGMLGLVALMALVVGPAVRTGGIVAPGEAPAAAAAFRSRAVEALAGATTGWWRAWWAFVAAGLVGLVLLPVAVLYGLRAGPGGSADLLLHSRFGTAWWVQVGCLALAAAAAAALARRGPRAVPGTLSAGWAWALGVPPAVALVAIGWAGHASSGGDSTANVVIDALHSGATAVWLGGLVGLAVLVSPALARLDATARVRLAAAVVVRFSAVALTAVGVLVVTGVYRALAEVELGEVLDSDYGRVLVVKLGIFTVLLAGGAYNRLIVHPRLERAALGLDPDDRGASAALRTSVRAELVLAAALMVSVALLISLPPPG